MEADFWLKRWQENKIGFHLEAVNQWLIKCLSRFNLSPGAHIFMPLCGKSEDIIYLVGLGFKVSGVEISLKAVEDFFIAHSLSFSTHNEDGFDVYGSGNITVYRGNFFKLDRIKLSRVDLIYDRAALIAMPAPMRESYSAVIKNILAQGSTMLLVSMDYPGEEMEGPPFAVSGDEISRLYRGFNIHKISAHPLAGESKFSSLSYAKEEAYQIS